MVRITTRAGEQHLKDTPKRGPFLGDAINISSDTHEPVTYSKNSTGKVRARVEKSVVFINWKDARSRFAERKFRPHMHNRLGDPSRAALPIQIISVSRVRIYRPQTPHTARTLIEKNELRLGRCSRNNSKPQCPVSSKTNHAPYHNLVQHDLEKNQD